MQTSRSDKAKLGFFILLVLGVLAAVVIALVTYNFQVEEDPYKIYFAESVSGIQPGSTVTLSGVQVGRVTSLRVNPENVEQIEVMVGVDVATPIKQDTHAYLVLQGVTGLKAIDLRDSTHSSPKLEPGGTIKVGQGLLDKLASRADDVSLEVNEVMKGVAYLTREENLKRVDHMLVQSDELITNVNTMAQEFSRTALVVRQLLERNESELDRTLRNVSRASGQLDGVMREATLTMKAGRDSLESAEFGTFMVGLDQTNTVLREKIGAVDVQSLMKTLNGLQVLMLEVVRSLTQNQEQFRATLFNLRQTSDNVKALSRELRDQPSRLIFDETPKERKLP